MYTTCGFIVFNNTYVNSLFVLFSVEPQFISLLYFAILHESEPQSRYGYEYQKVLTPIADAIYWNIVTIRDNSVTENVRTNGPICYYRHNKLTLGLILPCSDGPNLLISHMSPLPATDLRNELHICDYKLVMAWRRKQIWAHNSMRKGKL